MVNWRGDISSFGRHFMSMRRVNDVVKTTNNRFLNMYELDMLSDEGKHSKYFLSSRAECIEDLKITTRINKADGVIIYAIYKDDDAQDEKVVLIRQGIL